MKVRFAVLLAGLLAVAGCSSPAGSSGAVQDNVVASTASAVAAPGESQGGLTAMRIATANNNGVCDTGLAFACGDTGASGVGTVFYASATPFACGPNLASSCNFLEVAPNLWNPNSASNCPGKDCGGSTQRTSDMSGTGKGITMCMSPPKPLPLDPAVGTGYANTTAWAAACKPYDAPNIARAYQGGGMTDWSLPSLNELTALYYYPNRDAIGGFVPLIYWSSTGYSSSGPTNVNVVIFKNAEVAYELEINTRAMRPVRAF